MSDTTTSIATFMEEFLAENKKFEGGNNAAGTRARKALQEVIKFAREARKGVQEEKNARKASKS